MSLNKFLLLSVIGMVIFGGLLTVAKIWFPVMAWDTYIKVMMTLGLLILVAGLVMILRADLGEHKKLKDENYLD